MKIAKRAAQFCIGGGAYVGLELLYRGHSHITMFGAGGLCFLLLGHLPDTKLPRVLQAGCGAGIITAVELATGLLFNRQYQVWDYRQQPFNFLGQICPVFSAIWVPVGMAAMILYKWVDGGLDTLTPHIRSRSVG